MQRQTILRLMAIVALAGLTACSGGSNSSPTPQTPPSTGGGASDQHTATTAATIDGSAQNFTFPATYGFQEEITFLKRNGLVPVTVQMTVSDTPPTGFSAAPLRHVASGEIALLYYNVFTFTSPVDFTFYPPGIALTLPNSVPTTTGQFYYGISPLPASPSSGYATPNPGYATPNPYAGIVLRTEGPATVSGQTLTFAPSDNPVTLVAGNSYIVVFYRTCTLVSGATSC